MAFNILVFSICATVGVFILAGVFMAVEKVLGIKDTPVPAAAHKPVDVPEND